MQSIKIFSRISLASLSLTLLILSVGINLSGCGTLNRKFPTLPQYKLTKTGVGAATGTALGGGVGAVIGSASGNVGQGAALGALSGATAGAVIGKQLQKGEQAIALQKRKLDQQSSQIEQLNREIDSLRYESGDRIGSQRGRFSGNLRGAVVDGAAGSGSVGSSVRGNNSKNSGATGTNFGQGSISSARDSLKEAPVYRANVNGDELQKFLSRVPVRKPREEAEPVGASSSSRSLSKSPSKAPSRVRAKVKTSPRVTALDGKKFAKKNFINPQNNSESTYSKKSFKSEAVSPKKSVDIKVAEVKKVESKPLEKLSNKMKEPAKIEATKPKSRKIDLIKIPATESGVAKKETDSVRTAELNIQPPTIRKVGKSGAVKEQAQINSQAKSKAAAVYGSKLASIGAKAKSGETLGSVGSDTATGEKDLINTAKLAELESSDLDSKKPAGEIPTAAALKLPGSKIKHSSPSCLEAENEAERAREATSDADKLFYYRRALRLCGESSNYHFETARAYLAIGRREDAAFEFRQALDLDPNNKAAAQMLENMGQ